MSSFSDQIAAGLAIIRGVAGEAVTYFDGTDTIEITGAVPRRIISRADRQYDQVTILNGRIWDIEVAQMQVNDVAIVPQLGHVITHGSDVWEVLNDPLTGECWQYVDGGKSTVKVFCLRKGI